MALCGTLWPTTSGCTGVGGVLSNPSPIGGSSSSISVTRSVIGGSLASEDPVDGGIPDRDRLPRILVDASRSAIKGGAIRMLGLITLLNSIEDD